MGDAMRTSSGSPSQKAREQHGDSDEKYPIFDHKSAHSALMLRGHSSDPAKIIARVRAWANEHNDKAILAECDAAAEKDKKVETRSDSLDDLLLPIGVETRSSSVTVEDVNFPKGIITVLAAPYNQPTKVAFAGSVWNEVFMRSAFDSLDPAKRRVPALASLVFPNPNHDEGYLVGRIVEKRSEDIGLIADVKISRTPHGNETLELANDGSLSASVGFQVNDPRRDMELDRLTHTRKIHRAFLHHLAFVAVPAYQGADVLAVRSEPDLPVTDTPMLDEILNNPIWQWAKERLA